ncbi:unnamed protein product, partial [Meganyctiphanes norvegica]
MAIGAQEAPLPQEQPANGSCPSDVTLTYVQANTDKPDVKIAVSHQPLGLEVFTRVSSRRSKSQSNNVSIMPSLDTPLSTQTNNSDIPAHKLPFQPPDGGIRAWSVCIASLLCNGIIFGTINSSGLIYERIHNELKEKGDETAALKGSLVISLAIGSTFFLSMVAGMLTDRLGIRLTTFIGGAIATAGMFLSSYFHDRVEVLMLTFGLMFGGGSSLAYTPSLVILGHYFKRWMGLVNSLVTAGSIVLPFILPSLLDISLEFTFQVLSGITALLMVCSLIFKPLIPSLPPAETKDEDGNTCIQNCRVFWGQIINYEIWKNKRYVLWTFAISSAQFGYFVPYTHLVKFTKDVLGEETNTQILIQCIGGASGVGRIIFGLMSDRPWVNRIFLQQVSFISIGCLTMLLVVANNFTIFIVIALLMGFFDGCFISLLGPIAFDIVGPSGASQAIGCLLAMCSIPLTAGPAIAGWLYDELDGYTIPFLCAGIPPIVGAIILTFMRCIKTTRLHYNILVCHCTYLHTPHQNSNGALALTFMNCIKPPKDLSHLPSYTASSLQSGDAKQQK